MPFDIAQYIEKEPTEQEVDISKYISQEDALQPGEDWTQPIQDEHPDMGMFSRMGLKTFADAGPKTMIKNLEKKGFEARHRGGMRFSLRKPGEKEWYVLDPKQFELLDDITDFIPGLLFPLVGTIVGAFGGSGAGPVGTIPGAAAGSMAGEAVKQKTGELAGYEYDPQEKAGKLVTETVVGGAAEAAAPILQRGGQLAKRALVGEAGEVAARNLAKKEAYKRAVAATPEGAPFPTAPILEEVAEEGLLPRAARKWREARDVKTVLEGPKRKAREEFAGTAEKVIDEAFGETTDVSYRELQKRALGIEKRIEAAAAKGEDTSLLERRLSRIREAADVEKQFIQETGEVAKAGRAVTAAEKKVEAARGKFDKASTKVADLQDKITSKQARLDRAAGKEATALETQLTDLTREINRWDSWTSEYKRLKRAIPRVEKKLEKARAGVVAETAEIAALKKGLPRLKTQLDKANTVKKAAAKNLDEARKTAKVTKLPETEPLAKEAFIKNLAEDAGIPVTSKTGVQIVKALDKLITDKRYAEYLRSGQDPAVREAIDRQVRGVINALGPEEEFFVKYARREPKGLETAPESRYFREMLTTRDVPLDPVAWRGAAKDLEGKTLEEMRRVLDEAGWKGEVPDSIEGITEALYRARTEGIKGVGMSYDPVSKQLIGAESKYAGMVSDVDLRAAGGPSRRGFGAPETTELRTGGVDIPIGQEFAEQALGEMGPIQRAVAQPPGIARAAGRGLERLRRGTAAGLEGTAKAVGVPGQIYDYVGSKFLKAITPGKADRGVLMPLGGLGTAAYATGMMGTLGKGIALGFASKIAAGGLRAVAKAIMVDPKVLVALTRKATGPVAAKMQKPLQALQRRGTEAYKAAVFIMLHDPDVRNYLQGLEKKREE